MTKKDCQKQRLFFWFCKQSTGGSRVVCLEFVFFFYIGETDCQFPFRAEHMLAPFLLLRCAQCLYVHIQLQNSHIPATFAALPIEGEPHTSTFGCAVWQNTHLSRFPRFRINRVLTLIFFAYESKIPEQSSTLFCLHCDTASLSMFYDKRVKYSTKEIEQNVVNSSVPACESEFYFTNNVPLRGTFTWYKSSS